MTFDELVGANVRAARQRPNMSQDALAGRLRALGLPWTQPTVAALEKGRRRLTIPEFVLPAAALEVTPRDLLESDELKVQVAEGVTMSAPLLGALLYGSDDARDTLKAQAGFEDSVGGGSLEVLRAAQRLRITPEQLESLAQQFWGRSLIEERDALAEALGVAKGHITRRLIRQLMAADTARAWFKDPVKKGKKAKKLEIRQEGDGRL